MIIIPSAFFLNTYLINSNYEADIDKITQRKAVFVESLINNFIQEQLADDVKLQSLVDEIMEENDEIASFSIIKKTNDGFQVAASNAASLIGQNQNDFIQNVTIFLQQHLGNTSAKFYWTF